jgi:hypothetical protein
MKRSDSTSRTGAWRAPAVWGAAGAAACGLLFIALVAVEGHSGAAASPRACPAANALPADAAPIAPISCSEIHARLGVEAAVVAATLDLPVVEPRPTEGRGPQP